MNFEKESNFLQENENKNDKINDKKKLTEQEIRDLQNEYPRSAKSHDFAFF